MVFLIPPDLNKVASGANVIHLPESISALNAAENLDLESAIKQIANEFNLKLDTLRYTILSIDKTKQEEFLHLTKISSIKGSYEEIRVLLKKYKLLERTDLEIWKEVCKACITIFVEVYREMGFDKLNTNYATTFLHLLDENSSKSYRNKTLIEEFIDIYHASIPENEKMQTYFKVLRNRNLLDQSLSLNIIARLQN